MIVESNSRSTSKSDLDSPPVNFCSDHNADSDMVEEDIPLMADPMMAYNFSDYSYAQGHVHLHVSRYV